MTKIAISDMAAHYREIRKAVYEKGTEPCKANQQQHDKNKEKLKNCVVRICQESNLDLYRGCGKNTAISVWHHLWTKNRYAGIKSQTATTEILDIQSIFDDYEIFSKPSWDIEISGHTLVSGGDDVNRFLNREGVFGNKQTIGNLPKLKKLVTVARQLKKYVDEAPNESVLRFITNGNNESDIWQIHQHLMDIGYTSDLTVLHFMMDLGFSVIKPDIVISKLFLTWGWLHEAIPDLPSDLSINDLKGNGSYGARYRYTNKKMYKPLIDLARNIIAEVDQTQLEEDIGWVTNNPVREFDIFTVKYGQLPEQEWGIARTLFDER